MRNKILIFPSGVENGLEINEAIKHSLHVEVIPGSGKTDYSQLLYENEVRKLPFLWEENFIAALNELIEKEDIKLIFPTDDTASRVLAKNAPLIKAYVVSGDYYTNDICRFKSKTYELFKDEPFCPKVYWDFPEEREYPIFSKPDEGQGSVGAKLVRSRKEHQQLSKEKDRIFVEYLQGKEYTVDCFTDRKGELLFVGARERAIIKMGLSFKSVEEPMTEEISRIAHKINDKLNFRGLWFFQLKKDAQGHYKLLEVSTRTATTMGYFRHKGVNLPLLSVYDALGMDVEIYKKDYDLTLYRTTVNNYKYEFDFSSVYLDYDDTLIMDGKVNRDLISFIYQCKNNGIKLYLITKHGSDIYESLKKFCIAPHLFDEIIILALEDKKSDYITDPEAIFIDNWYQERKEVAKRRNIQCFDVDIVKSLMVN